MTGKSYTREFKLNVVQSIESGELRPAHADRAYQLAESVLARWRQEVRERGEAAFTPLAPSLSDTYELRIAELERVGGQLAIEHAALKKALQLAQSCPTTN